ncbi:MAG: DUF4174 domain-containing protein [Algoriphagus sp.]|uniref:DUF4174 domain-containing protein n=1 Tax=Algoriphagus sp. TaxID=1872435 RepID=UPI0026224F83|nr:DUF4174 domain-containing protein [Algoriphagus sp.]MDG1276080.1 DUF4174 domain-containing protein [Algoriphagus sp.]
MKLFIIFAFMLISIPFSKKQLNDFKWENRLIVTFDIPKNYFESVNPSDLKERKLLFFAFESGNLINSNFKGEIDQSEFLKLHEKYGSEYFLIGLDGGIKSMGQSKDFSLEKLIKQIDSMPMRQSELKKKTDGIK